MATLDELANRISVLENRYSTLNSVVNGHTTEIQKISGPEAESTTTMNAVSCGVPQSS